MYGAKTKGAVQPFFSALSPPSLWPVKPRARRLSTPRCGNEDRSRCAADLYRRGMFYVARGCVREGTTGTRAEERVALSDSKRPRGTPRMRDRGPPRRSIADRSQVQGVPRTDRLWSYTPGSGGYVMRVLCNDARCRFLSSLGVGGTQEIQGYFRFDQFRRCEFVFRHSVLVQSFRSGSQGMTSFLSLGSADRH